MIARLFGRKEVGAVGAFEFPRGYGLAYFSPMRPTAVLYPMPINVLVRSALRLWGEIRHGLFRSALLDDNERVRLVQAEALNAQHLASLERAWSAQRAAEAESRDRLHGLAAAVKELEDARRALRQLAGAAGLPLPDEATSKPPPGPKREWIQ